MSGEMPYADIIILALIAGFIVLRLRSVLGHRIGNDDPDIFKKQPSSTLEREPIIRPSEKALKPKGKEAVPQDSYADALSNAVVTESIKAIKARDVEFSASAFLEGAKGAFEMVFDGFAKGDKAPLKMLLDSELFKQFEAAIDARAGKDTKTETTLVSVQAKDIIRATLDGVTARLTVKFISEQITVVRDKEGKIIEGDPSEVHNVTDEWTFERDVTSKNPNWKIIDT